VKVVIAEKPDQALKLAAPFSFRKRDGYIEVGMCELFPKGAYFTWAVGHICELLPPEEYDQAWKRWTLEALPLIPDKFQYKVTKSKAKQFFMIRDLVKKPEVKEIIHAGDAGRR